MEKAIVSIAIGFVVGTYATKNNTNFWIGAGASVILTLTACFIIDVIKGV